MTKDPHIHHPTRYDHPDDDIAQLGRSWQAASDRVFGSAVEHPHLYQQAARIIGAFLTTLREQGRGIDALVESWHHHEEMLSRVVAGDGRLAMDGLDPELLAGAAFAIRHREAHEESAQQARIKILQQGNESSSWVLLEEAGYAPGDPFVAYRRLEALPARQAALLIATQPDESMSRCIHTVQWLHLDPVSGALLPPTDDIPQPSQHTRTTAEEREALVEELKSFWASS